MPRDDENHVLVQRLRTGDVGLLTQACALLRSEGEAPPRRCAEMLADPRAYFLVATVDSAIAGWITGFRLPRWSGDKMFLYELDVAETYRRRGVATALIESLWSICCDEGIATMFVMTEEANTAAMRAYEATGARRLHSDDVLWTWWADG